MSTSLQFDSVLDIQEGAALLDAMANANRLQVLEILSRGEMSVGPLSELIGLSQSALSQHLAKLRVAKLVTTRRDAQTVYYSCQSAPVLQVLALLAEFFDEDAADARQFA